MNFNYFLLITLLLSYNSFSQEQEKTRGLFYKISIAGTLTINEHYTIQTDDDENLLKLNGFFLNNTFGLQLDERVSIGLNAAIVFHQRQQLRFAPLFLSTHYNVIVDDANYFVRGGIGRLIKLGEKFEKGSLYKIGVGIQFFDENFKNSVLVGLDFSRKRFGYREENKLSSIAIFLEYRLF
ncbi:MAG: hypothetical protein JKY08_02415 [Flavobacteriaceae bacterium]|nr:hypothetical protein [Flavobacteriaceae bacterium]